MWCINSICQIVSALLVVSTIFCYARAMVNRELLILGFKPKYNIRKISLWAKYNVIIAVITLIVWIVNALICLC